jgi:hypothetical protein
MAETLANVEIPANNWVDLYALTGLTVGTAISVQNIGSADVYLTVAAAQPPVDHNAYNVISRNTGVWLRNTARDTGAWAFCPNAEGKLSVRPVA